MKKNIFYKKRNYKKIKYFSIFSILVITTFLYFFSNNFYNKNLFKIQEFDKKRYVLLDNLGGKIIPDFGVDILENLSNNSLNTNYNLNLENIIYSIQLEISNSLSEINDKIIYYSNDKTIDSNRLYVGEFNSNLGKKFILLYSNYENRQLAQNNCNKLKTIGTKCLVINVQKLKNL